MKLFNNAFTPLLILPPLKQKFFDLNPGCVLERVEPNPYFVDQHDGFTRVIYTNNDGKAFDGFIRSDHLEQYWETLPKDCVHLPQTPSPNDFAQYLLWEGHKVVNACGEIAVAYALKVPFDKLIKDWQFKSPNVWKRIRGQGRWAGTGPADLIDLVNTQGCTAYSLSTVLKRYTMSGLQELLNKGHVIASCNIDGGTGRLRGKGVLHWANVIAVQPERQWGFIDIMNPAPNRVERYQWENFVASAGQVYGIYIPHQRIGGFDR